jgi:hypothetical protein
MDSHSGYSVSNEEGPYSVSRVMWKFSRVV